MGVTDSWQLTTAARPAPCVSDALSLEVCWLALQQLIDALDSVVAAAVQVQPSDLQPLTFASHTYDTFHLLMPLYGGWPSLCKMQVHC